MKSIALTKFLIDQNKDLVNKTALTNCHCIGLNSFIINEKPRIRLFVADQNCELFSGIDILSPIIPIHAHKYDDIFCQLEGSLIHYFYKIAGLRAKYEYSFKRYQYSRIGDEKKIEWIGSEVLEYLGHNVLWLGAVPHT